MKNFFIIANGTKDPDFIVTSEIRQIIESLGGKCLGAAKVQPQDGEEFFASLRQQITGADCILVLGGDGTILRAARNLYTLGIPFLGINLGHVGYLTEGGESNAAELLEKLFRDDYVIENRMLLKGCTGEGINCEEKIALNDITLNRSNSLRVIEFNLIVNGEILYNYRADGIIVSTPTGSTAYNLSCGGPIATPTSRLILVTPIAPHSLNNRSLVLSAEDRIEIEIVGSDKDTDNQVRYMAYFDGDDILDAGPGMRLRIRAVDDVVKLVRLNRQSFLQTLKAKMG